MGQVESDHDGDVVLGGDQLVLGEPEVKRVIIY